MASNNPTFKTGFFENLEDLQNVSEMAAETSEASKDRQSESTTGENNTCTYSENNTCTYVHVQNLQFDQCTKSDFSA